MDSKELARLFIAAIEGRSQEKPNVLPLAELIQLTPGDLPPHRDLLRAIRSELGPDLEPAIAPPSNVLESRTRVKTAQDLVQCIKDLVRGLVADLFQELAAGAPGKSQAHTTTPTPPIVDAILFQSQRVNKPRTRLGRILADVSACRIIRVQSWGAAVVGPSARIAAVLAAFEQLTKELSLFTRRMRKTEAHLFEEKTIAQMDLAAHKAASKALRELDPPTRAHLSAILTEVDEETERLESRFLRNHRNRRGVVVLPREIALVSTELTETVTTLNHRRAH